MTKIVIPGRLNVFWPAWRVRDAVRPALSELDLRAGEMTSRPAADCHLVVGTWSSEREEGCFDALISALRPGIGQLSLRGVVVAARETRRNLVRLGRYTRRGDIALDDLPADGVYRLTVRSPDVRVGPVDIAVGGARAIAALNQAGQPGVPVGADDLEKGRKIRSPDERVTADLTREGNHVRAVFRSRRPELANAIVYCAFLDPDDETVLASDSLRLAAAGVRHDRWEGERALALPVPRCGRCTFRFEVTLAER